MPTAMSPSALQSLKRTSEMAPHPALGTDPCIPADPHQGQLYLLVFCAFAFQRAHIHTQHSCWIRDVSNSIPMTWTRSQPATAHRAPIYPPFPRGCTRVQVLWNGNLFSCRTDCPGPHTRLCMHSDLRE